MSENFDKYSENMNIICYFVINISITYLVYCVMLIIFKSRLRDRFIICSQRKHQ